MILILYVKVSDRVLKNDTGYICLSLMKTVDYFLSRYGVFVQNLH